VPHVDVPDAFELELPTGWVSTSVGAREYTLSSGEDGDLRINVVVYQPRTKNDALPDARIAAVREWAKGIGMQDSESLNVLTPGGDTPRAFATLRGEGRDVFVGFFYFKKSFVIAAASAPSDNPAGLKRLEQMLWSIEAN
jgi:hypothetical protein